MKRIFTLLTVTVLLASCGIIKKREVDKISKQEKLLVQDAQNGKVDSAKVMALLTAYEAFADKYPGDTTAAGFLFNAAKFYQYMHQPLRSIAMYEKIYNNFPKLDKRPYALFLQGFAYENEVGNKTAAKVKYEQFIKEYPDHPVAKDVKLALKYIDKTPEEMLREFQEIQSADSIAAAQNK